MASTEMAALGCRLTGVCVCVNVRVVFFLCFRRQFQKSSSSLPENFLVFFAGCLF